MLYLTESDVTEATLTCRTLCGAGDAPVMNSQAGVRRVAETARAFNRALASNGGPFETEAVAKAATRAVLDADWGRIARLLRSVLRVVALLYPQSSLFVTVFSVLFDMWSAKNNRAAGIAS